MRRDGKTTRDKLIFQLYIYFQKGCIYICKFYCTENIQNVHNYRYSIPQSCPGITKHSCSALEKLCSLFVIIILNTFSTYTFNVCQYDYLFFFFSSPSVLYKHSPFTVVKQGTRIVMWSRRPCVKQERASDRPTQVTGSHECDVFISWNRISLTPKHYTQWGYVLVWVCMSALVKRTEFQHVDGIQRTRPIHIRGERACWVRLGAPHRRDALSATEATAKRYKSTRFPFLTLLREWKGKKNPVSHN